MPSGKSTPPDAADDALHIANILRSYTFRYADEDALQRGVASVLPGSFTREFPIDARSRLDFLVHRESEVAIEIKIAGAASEVERQISRYLKSEAIDALILVTTRRRHRKIDVSRFDKPVVIVWLGLSGF